MILYPDVVRFISRAPVPLTGFTALSRQTQTFYSADIGQAKGAILQGRLQDDAFLRSDEAFIRPVRPEEMPMSACRGVALREDRSVWVCGKIPFLNF